MLQAVKQKRVLARERARMQAQQLRQKKQSTEE
jgi:hypothetical protein